jgi:membrane protein
MSAGDPRGPATGQARHGTRAEQPGQIPARGWLEIAKRVRRQVKEDQVALLAAGVAFYAILALAPALISVVTLYGLVADPAEVEQQMEPVIDALPEGASDILREQLTTIAEAPATGLSIGLVVSLALTLWAASSGMQGLIKAVNLAYDEPDRRGFVRLRALALAMTLCAIGFTVVAVGLIAVLPAVLGALGLGPAAAAALRWGRWPLLAVLAVIGLAAVYRYAPDRDKPRRRWVSWGAVIAGVLWLAGSALFSFYVSTFGSYNETYGSLAGVIVLLLWLWLSSFVVLLGAEINAEAEHQTVADTTDGPPQPMGVRDAHVADTTPGRRAR